MKFLKLSLMSIIATTALFAGTYNVDRSHSDVGFKIKHMMISNVKGNFNTFTGVIEYDEKTKTIKALSGKIDVNSINTENEKRDNHLKSPDFFDVKISRNYICLNKSRWGRCLWRFNYSWRNKKCKT